ncbi:MAG TPA: aldehyde dehydrogenase family protein [Longimicrobiales bacterium]|nr:aldehyde dehydrogenase family protein [Longimicrobiales bacterium]
MITAPERAADEAAGEIVVRAPSSGAELGRVPVLGGAQVRAALAAARAAQPAWAALPVRERARRLTAFRRLLAEHARDIAGISSAETGKLPFEAMMVDVLTTCDLAAWYAKRADTVLSPRRTPAGWLITKKAWIEREPYGVVAVIGPWNFPVLNTMRAVMAGIVAGNAVLLKPSELTPLSALAVQRLAREAGVPEAVFQVLTGDGGTGRALVEAGVDKISFTGSVETGRAIARAAADRLIPVTLELGGKDPVLVTEGADVRRAARTAVNGAFWNAGQICISIERAYVVDAVYDEFIEEALRATRALRVGTPEDADADVGAMTTAAQTFHVERQVRDAIERGARVLAGGERAPGGRAWLPTLLVDVTHDMDVMRSETFGPVLPVMRVRDADEAVRLANDSGFALGASVWGPEGDARRLAGRLRAGMVCINDALVNGTIASLPFGGAGESGYGRVYGDEGLRELSRPRALLADRAGLGWEPGLFPLRRFGLPRALGLVRALHGRGVVQRVRGLLSLLRGK